VLWGFFFTLNLGDIMKNYILICSLLVNIGLYMHAKSVPHDIQSVTAKVYQSYYNACIDWASETAINRSGADYDENLHDCLNNTEVEL